MSKPALLPEAREEIRVFTAPVSSPETLFIADPQSVNTHFLNANICL